MIWQNENLKVLTMNRLFSFFIFLVAFISSATLLFSQTGTLKGFVLDKESGEPCMFANVSIPTEKINLGASTDVNGYFSIPKRMVSWCPRTL